MAHKLQNNKLEVEVDLPLENYNHSRFDWSGKIVGVKFRDKSLSGDELIEPVKGQYYGRGFYNEFGIDMPLGYNELDTGEWFHKIGVGLLKKDEASYNFHKHYEIKPAEFVVALEPDKIRIQCHAPLYNGYAYLLKKEILLLESGFEIRYELENSGEKTIITNEYNHNFLAIDKQLIGSDYVLKFPFHVQPALFGERVNPEGIVEIGQEDIRFNGTPGKQFFFSNLSGGKVVHAKWALENTRSKIGISEAGDFQTDAINLWGWQHVISPELFIKLNIQPGRSMKWSRTYSVYEIS